MQKKLCVVFARLDFMETAKRKTVLVTLVYTTKPDGALRYRNVGTKILCYKYVERIRMFDGSILENFIVTLN